MKLQCSCGAKYAFDVTPEMANNPVKFVCPACGLDSSAFVNALVRQQLGLAPAPAPAPMGVPLDPAPASAPPPPAPVKHAPAVRLHTHQAAAPAAAAADDSAAAPL
ncbi:MAG TPA: hypothetical protein VNZ22_18540, partial [Bacillota bacterium]|nr:hypothetical protein [Bacillota bacterium]